MPDNNVGIHLPFLSMVDDLDFFFPYPWGRVGYRRLLHGFRGSFARKFQKAKRRKEKEITCTVHGFPIAMQVWAFEEILEIGERFDQRVEAEQPYLSSLMLYDDPLVPMLDDIVRTVVASQIHSLYVESGGGGQSGGQDLEDRVRSGRSGDGETSGDDEVMESREVIVKATTVRIPVTFPPLQRHRLTKWEVEELLLDQRILFEMRLRTVKLEIEQHMTFECTRLREFIAAQVGAHPPTTAPRSTGAIF
ncbi:Hypothetical predicted protein [Olea europaea subsp. europaea]|uniref:Uncharacterized protein n=1 Tax=Olea europaea subsp. europaea TaxID=158383 RepID=A0A8S0QII5_OLEEU|nr:Hypothetical predicted protein [Olea europaea subsp. europaea]